MMKPWKKLSSRDVHRDRWVRLRADRVELPSGKAIEPYYVMEEPEWVHVCALSAQNEILLGRQYRYAGEAFGYELPGGTTDAGEDLVFAAQRELLEETGAVADDWRHVCGLLTNPARTNNRIHCFLAHNARIVQAPQLEETEDIVSEFVPFTRVLELIRTGEINQAMHIAMLHQTFLELGWMKPTGPA
ncbi:NUDIX hydrolase [Oleiharenicola lentus]|uniref:NUDIX hydrolase n=1 Tax=Oleiharenicola lentus TaxID=2508720 RepID=UPI003F665A01